MKETQNINVLFLQSKSATKLLQEIKNELSPKVKIDSELKKTSIQEIIRCAVKNKIIDDIETNIKKEILSDEPVMFVKKKKRFKKISGNLMFLNL